jgi:hypothetical protein
VRFNLVLLKIAESFHIYGSVFSFFSIEIFLKNPKPFEKIKKILKNFFKIRKKLEKNGKIKNIKKF